MALVLSRRQLLFAAAAASACSPKAVSPGGASSTRIIVIGGGLAGLAVAHQLVAKGHEVMVLEAQSRVGGRIQTIRAPFRDGLYVEAGAKHVVGEPGLLALIKEVGIEVVKPERPRRAPPILVKGGQRRVRGADEKETPMAGLTAEEAALGFPQQLTHYFQAEAQGDPRQKAWVTGDRSRLDTLDLVAALHERKASPSFVQLLVDMVGMGEPPKSMSALWVSQQVASVLQEISWGGGGRIAGGSDRFPEAIAARLGARILLGAQVETITQGKGEVQVTFMQRGSRQTVTGARVVLAVHAPVARELPIDPPLSPLVREALDRLQTSSVVRGWAQLDRKLWEDHGSSGDATLDDPFISDLHDETNRASATSGMLSFYTTGDSARALRQLGKVRLHDRLASVVEQAHPGAQSHLIATETKVWDEDPFARGAYTFLPPGFLTRLMPALNRSEGRLHFAGDYTSYRPGFMHGALHSAERVVGEIVSGWPA